MVRCLVRNAYALDNDKLTLPVATASGDELEAIQDANLREPKSRDLMQLLEKLTELMLNSWLAHSRTLRLSI